MRSVSFCAALALTAWPLAAHAVEKAGEKIIGEKACFEAAESGQKLRKSAKLKEADDKFQVCAQSTCPGVVTQDCTKWHTEVTALLPTVALSAKGSDGKDLIDVRVALDGDQLTARLDGKAITVNPGVHEFRFEVEGETPIVERVVLNEGEKARRVSVRFGRKYVEEGKSFPVAAVVLGGVGVAALGVGIGVYAKGSSDYPGDCDRNTRKCGDPANLTAGQNADNLMIAGMWTAIAGGAILAGGIAWFIIDRVTPAKQRKDAYITPTSVGFRF
jgi:hypothetical protein